MKFKSFLESQNITNENPEVTFQYVGGDNEEDKNPDIDYDKGINNVIKNSEINILRGKEPNTVAIADGIVVGVLFTEFDGSEYSFDAAVLPNYRKKGIGSKLVDIGIAEFDQYSDIEGTIMRIDAVNPFIEKTLLKKGFKIEGKQNGHTIMIYQ
jgi:ribosomal protein S18 acetylase RimI-like enzyme